MMGSNDLIGLIISTITAIGTIAAAVFAFLSAKASQKASEEIYSIHVWQRRLNIIARIEGSDDKDRTRALNDAKIYFNKSKVVMGTLSDLLTAKKEGYAPSVSDKLLVSLIHQMYDVMELNSDVFPIGYNFVCKA